MYAGAQPPPGYERAPVSSASEAEYFTKYQVADCRIWVDPCTGTVLGTKDRAAVAARLAAYGSATTVGDYYHKHPGGPSPLGTLQFQDLCLGFLTGDILYHPTASSLPPKPRHPTPPGRDTLPPKPPHPTPPGRDARPAAHAAAPTPRAPKGSGSRRDVRSPAEQLPLSAKAARAPAAQPPSPPTPPKLSFRSRGLAPGPGPRVGKLVPDLTLAFSDPDPAASPPQKPLSVASPHLAPPGVWVSLLFTVVSETPADILCVRNLTDLG